MGRRWSARGLAVALLPLLPLLASSASVSGCALLFVTTDGLSGGDHADTARPDGAVDQGDGRSDLPAGGDAGSDGSFTLDGGLLEDGAPARFCTANPGHTLCSDFDDDGDLAPGWTTNVSGRGMIRADTTHTRSPPNSFLARTTAGAAGVSTAQIGRTVGVTNRMRFSFDVYVTPPAGPVGDSIATVKFSGGYLDVLWFETGTVWITERGVAGPNIDHVSPQKIPANTWVRVQLEVVPGKITMKLDGVTVIDDTTARTYDGTAGVGLGIYSNDALAIDLHYDDVLADIAF